MMVRHLASSEVWMGVESSWARPRPSRNLNITRSFVQIHDAAGITMQHYGMWEGLSGVNTYARRCMSYFMFRNVILAVALDAWTCERGVRGSENKGEYDWRIALWSFRPLSGKIQAVGGALWRAFVIFFIHQMVLARKNITARSHVHPKTGQFPFQPYEGSHSYVLLVICKFTYMSKMFLNHFSSLSTVACAWD